MGKAKRERVLSESEAKAVNADLDKAIEILEGVIADDPSLRIAVPTLAICYVQANARERGAALLKDDTLAAAEADSEMAYRLATYFAVDGDSSDVPMNVILRQLLPPLDDRILDLVRRCHFRDL